MNLNQILNSRQSGRFALTITRYIPPGIGKSLTSAIAKYLVRRPDLPLIHATRINQWVAQDQNLTREQLDKEVLDTIQNYTLSMYTLFHYWENLKPLEKMIRYDQPTENLIARSQERKHGAMVVFIHSCNSDVSLRAASSRGLNGLVLSLPEANEAIEWQHAMRESSGIEVKAASIAVLREASERMKAGETVATGLDRPMPESKYKPLFFGRPTALPVHYIYLALKAKVPVALLTAIRQPDGIFELISSDLIEMKKYQDRQKEVLMNAGTILEIAEDFIRRAPTQWSVLHPLWPEEADKLPV